ncbi:MarR family winged helix-turn-helix transcriptional regulator [Stakelama sp. CBK3Z-3]|uniref:MarR family winged helix-turn-helix transcriptional regulator n=1 Tax=Stakelama flava TaxID=2860338 RepID=A0ABS6XNL6_9SPHN|nr:MarR family winged helix-turn-helix transcriptional regulator [Stakelama flava]MBW4331808.1 MarR family winged helix-turn-helix transcriptional regulator [Stakelama flava]
MTPHPDPELETIASQFGHLFLRMHRMVDRRMAAQGASFARTKLLLYVAKAGGDARAVDIADTFSQAPRTVTQGIDALERDGLIERVPDPIDRRAKRLRITEAGRAAIAVTHPIRLHLIDQLFGTLSPDERAELAKILERLANAMAEIELTGAGPDAAADAK